MLFNGGVKVANIYDALRSDEPLDLAIYEKKVIDVIKKQVGSGSVLLALSGGVDSSVCAALLAKAVPGKLHCIYVDTGLMRKNETDEVIEAFKGFDLNLICVDAAERFLARLAGVTDPELKRKVIGEEFVRIFEYEAKKLEGIEFLAQGTIYPDVVESGANGFKVIKSHHNVGGLPEDMGFKGLVEPLRALCKGDVRDLGLQLGLPAALVGRQPFPGPGLSVRIIGEVTREKLDILREVDYVFRTELDASHVVADQYFAVLTDLRTVGIFNGVRSYGYTVALRAVASFDFMTAKYVHIPHDLLERISEKITSEVPDVSRVVYDITSKPPATIEWE